MTSRAARLIAVMALLGVACGKPPPEPASPPVTRSGAVPSLTLPRVGRGELALSELRGRPVVLTLFATWDLRSQAEAPLMQELHQSRRDDVHVVGVALGPLGAEGLPLVQAFMEVMGITYPVLLAEPDDLSLVGALGLTRQVPRTLLLDEAGRVQLDLVGQTDFPRLMKHLGPTRAPKP